MSAANTELSQTINELSLALRSLESRHDNDTSTLEKLKRSRKDYVRRLVHELVPDLSTSTYNRIKVLSNTGQLGTFLSAPVESVFTKPGAIFGIFKGKVYRYNLSLVQTNLASFLDRSTYGDLGEIDSEIRAIQDNLLKNGKSRDQLLKTINEIQTAIKLQIDLPHVAKSELRQFVEKSRANRVRATKPPTSGYSRSAQNNSSNVAYVESYDDSDLWIYALTNFPTSTRTLLFDVISSGHNSSTENTRALDSSQNDNDINSHLQQELNCTPTDDETKPRSYQGGYSECDAPSSTPSGDNGSSESSTSTGAAVGVGLGVAAYAISTDDSLGAYS